MLIYYRKTAKKLFFPKKRIRFHRSPFPPSEIPGKNKKSAGNLQDNCPANFRHFPAASGHGTRTEIKRSAPHRHFIQSANNPFNAATHPSIPSVPLSSTMS